MNRVFTYFIIEKRNQDSGNWEQIDKISVFEPPPLMQKKSFLWFNWIKETEDLYEKVTLTKNGKIEAVKLAKIFAEREKDVRVLHYKFELVDYGEGSFGSILLPKEIWKNGDWLT